MTGPQVSSLIALVIGMALIWRFRHEAPRLRSLVRPFMLGSAAMIGMRVLNVPLAEYSRWYSGIVTLVVWLAVILGLNRCVGRLDRFSKQEKRNINLLWICAMLVLLRVGDLIADVLTRKN